MTPDERALRDAFLAECWQPCRELSREERGFDRALADERSQAVQMAGDKRDRRAS